MKEEEEEEEGRPGRPTMVGGKWELGSYKVGSGPVTLISPFFRLHTSDAHLHCTRSKCTITLDALHIKAFHSTWKYRERNGDVINWLVTYRSDSDER